MIDDDREGGPQVCLTEETSRLKLKRYCRQRGWKNLGRPTSLHKRSEEVFAPKAKGMGIRAISRQLGMAVSSVHSVLVKEG